MATPWQKLAAFVVDVNQGSNQLHAFADAGGRIVAPVVYNDFSTGPGNLAALPTFRQMCSSLGVDCWVWCNGFGADPVADAQKMAVVAQGSKGIILDLEAAYQWPTGNPNAMPVLARAIRQLLPKTEIGITTNGLNNASIWNGRTLVPPQSMYDLGIRVIPQWYTWMYQKNAAESPDQNMKWLKTFGATDGNFADKTASNGRGVPLSYVHGAVETTGLEGSDLADELRRLAAAQQFGYTTGFWIYTLDNVTPGDLQLLRQQQGKLFLT